MNQEQKLDKKMKFALIGTSSAGKTTLSLRILADLKRLGVLADGVLQQDRRLMFDRDKLETDIEAQYCVVFNMVVQESAMFLKDGVEVVISDRSVLDFYGYMEHQYGRIEHVWQFVLGWCKSYDVLYYLKPLKYHDDGNRPSDDFRTRVAAKIESLIEEIKAIPDSGINIQMLDRDDVYPDLLNRIKRLLSEEELMLMPQVLEQECLVGGSYAFNRATKNSDVDVYILGDKTCDRPELSKLMRGVYGANIEVRQVTRPIWEYFIEGKFRLLQLRQSNIKFTQGGNNNPLPLGIVGRDVEGKLVVEGE